MRNILFENGGNEFMAVYYNENGDLQNFQECENVCICKYCGKPYHQYCEEQVPGFRDRSDDICPYCHEENGSSMSEEYFNSPFSDEELKEYCKNRDM